MSLLDAWVYNAHFDPLELARLPRVAEQLQKLVDERGYFPAAAAAANTASNSFRMELRKGLGVHVLQQGRKHVVEYAQQIAESGEFATNPEQPRGSP